MPVPDFQSLMRPLLIATNEVGVETSMKNLAPIIAATLGLSAEDVAALNPSGRMTTFMNRLHWAKIYLDRAKLLESTRRGSFIVTQRGRDLIQSSPAPISMKSLEQYPEYMAWRAEATGNSRGANGGSLLLPPLISIAQEQTPEEAIGQGVSTIEADIKKTLLDRMQSASPAFF